MLDQPQAYKCKARSVRFGIRLDLARMRSLMRALGDPQATLAEIRMILVDTSVWVEFLARRGGREVPTPARLQALLYEDRVLCHPAVIGAWTTVAPMQMDEVCVSVILSGVCERHPRLRLVLGESGIGWLPYILERLDDTYEERLADDLELPLPPSAYFKRQMYATFQKDFHGVRAMAEIAPDNVMWGSDYPHRDGTWPFSRKAIEEQFRGIDPTIQRKMLWENVRRVYRIAE